ncbi:hypothetical protein COU74_00500 [Candidatus Peregrinibacteria bacterium CG10_big_fil_rev_8_21_14_0_10_36_19]|nr:MAG: hypothetical protein COU74_00500 [Candidatus Peregrinibacteria bacterium CG10_big_fil_rev_8_21_14_0_10_36_19]
MKKFLISLLVLAFVVPSSVFAATAFPDVPEDHTNFKAINTLNEKGIINGYENGTFGPKDYVNRAQAAKIIVGAMKVKHDEEYEVLFGDVPKSQWYFKYVMGAQKEGIINGSDGKFRPEEKVNLAETLKMLALAAKVELPTSVDANVFLDVDASQWFAPHAQYAREKNIVVADKNGKLNASSPMTRAAFSEVIYRMMYVTENDNKAFPLHTNWPYFENDTLPFKMKYDNTTWEVMDSKESVTFIKKDVGQFSGVRTFPNSGVATVMLDENTAKLSSTDYFSKIKAAFKGATITEFTVKNKKALEVVISDERIVDWYVYLNNGKILAVYTQFGEGPMSFTLKPQIKAMLTTLDFKTVEDKPDYSALLSEILAGVLKKNEGMNLINKLPENVIIETDTIGVGTGPIDYYYSSSLNYTFKYERNDDLILDTRKGKTTSF